MADRPISIERLIAQIAKAERERIRYTLARDSASSDERMAAKRRSARDRRRLVELTRDVYGIMRRNVPPGHLGTDRRALVEQLNDLKRGVLAWIDDNIDPLRGMRRQGRPLRTPFHPAIERLRAERGMKILAAAKYVAAEVVEHHWPPGTLRPDEFGELYPNTEHSLEPTQIRDRFARALNTAYHEHKKAGNAV